MSIIKAKRGTLSIELFSDYMLRNDEEILGYAKGPCKGCEEMTEDDYKAGDENNWLCVQCGDVEYQTIARARIAELEAELATLKAKDSDREKHLSWYYGLDTGISSETIFGVMTDIPVRSNGIPYDLDDFGRCYRLLQLFPEWKSRLSEVSEKFPEWALLIDNWDQIESLYESKKKLSKEKCYNLLRACRDNSRAIVIRSS